MQILNKKELIQKGLFRTLPQKKTGLIDFSTNDYLDLSNNPEVVNAAINAAKKFGIGSTGSRLLSGNIELFEEFENQIANDIGTESAIIFCSGFQANFSVLSTLLKEIVPVNIYFNKKNHSSLYQALSLSNTKVIRYTDINHLKKIISKDAFIVTESLFGMDGEIVDVEEIANLSNFLYLDEAHAIGTIHTYGLFSKLRNKPSGICMGAFGKALGGAGAFIGCSNEIKELIVNKSPGFIYSTAPSPMLIAGVQKAWQLIKNMDKERNHIKNLCSFIKDELNIKDNYLSPIVTLKTKDPVSLKEKLIEKGFLVSAIRPPTVPSSIIRISLSSKHSFESVKSLCDTLKEICGY